MTLFCQFETIVSQWFLFILSTKDLIIRCVQAIAFQIPDFSKDAAGESGVRPLTDPEIPPSPWKGGAN
ncbi:hypothetical protein [Calothrix sp. NIES-2100]|uniref:hypothetical protein n=1 Tax=Calothrix sp. NIES-2100 TaxID=1954172 RepID=UPI000BBC9624